MDAGAPVNWPQATGWKPLLHSHWYDALAVLLDQAPPAYRGAARLATAARRVLDLDAEDFAAIAAEWPTHGPGGWPPPRFRSSPGIPPAVLSGRWCRCMS